ncbi:uncharacterized protein [Watersipora subatra]|uniref:uncharacterized protein n=1 Tax=Watersipora subatra TaxID=2589382 RepID=UPI00355C6BEB
MKGSAYVRTVEGALEESQKMVDSKSDSSRSGISDSISSPSLEDDRELLPAGSEDMQSECLVPASVQRVVQPLEQAHEPPPVIPRETQLPAKLADNKKSSTCVFL